MKICITLVGVGMPGLGSVSKREGRLKRVTLTLDPDDYAAMEKLAKRSEVSSSWRRAVREFLERHRIDDRISPADEGKR
ncbi:CopG family transcriptional regulator [Propionivibrio sp.]|uniref:ribbon-helix-helix domain-containing protein n=1 Tax=Propionivibrio sp. TaxID=2212460 RepID=UPI003BF3CB7E